jgi:predicted house-cleaning NTP pyrophosphatase (Maf/HAM1 superfamily)
MREERSISEDSGARKVRMRDLADDRIETKMRSEQSSETAGGMKKNKLLRKQ